MVAGEQVARVTITIENAGVLIDRRCGAAFGDALVRSGWAFARASAGDRRCRCGATDVVAFQRPRRVVMFVESSAVTCSFVPRIAAVDPLQVGSLMYILKRVKEHCSAWT